MPVFLKDKNILIFGFGKEGVAAANHLGNGNRIAILDEKTKKQIDQSQWKKIKAENVNYYLGGHVPDEKFDLIVRSPGIRPDHPIIQYLVDHGVQLTSPTRIFFEECPSKIIGVTGTKGKGTSATLIYKILKTKYDNVYLAGNIGTPALEVLPQLSSKSTVVLELSSFQLIDLNASPQIAVVLMITSEHLDWHKDREEYTKAKESIVKFQTRGDTAIINRDYSESLKFSKLTKGRVLFFSVKDKTSAAYIKDDRIFWMFDKGEEQICKTSDVLLPGRHNLQNVLAAVLVAKVMNVSNKNIVSVLGQFSGLKHRLQLVGKIKGVSFINDSYSTIPETAIAALDAFGEDKVLILGGSSKNSDFSTLGRKIIADKKLKAIVLVGQEAGRIKKTISKYGQFSGNIVEGAKNMRQIIISSMKYAKSKDVVILSPACASFDMFKNYEDRGDLFIKEVNKLKSK